MKSLRLNVKSNSWKWLPPEHNAHEAAVPLNSELFIYKPKKTLRLNVNSNSWKWLKCDKWAEHMYQVVYTKTEKQDDDQDQDQDQHQHQHQHQHQEDPNQDQHQPQPQHQPQHLEQELSDEFSLDQALDTIEKKALSQIVKVEHWDEDQQSTTKDQNQSQTTKHLPLQSNQEASEIELAMTKKADQTMHAMALLKNQDLSMSATSTPAQPQLHWETVSKYETCSRFLKSNVLSLRASLLLTNEDFATGTNQNKSSNVEYTRACMERAECAKEIALLLDRVSLLLPDLNKPMPLSPIQSNPHHRERRVREAAKNYGQRSRNLAKYKKLRLEKNAHKNRTKYFALRRTRAKADEERRKRLVKERQMVRDQQRHSGAIALPPKDWERNEGSQKVIPDDDFEKSMELNGAHDADVAYFSNKQQHADALAMDLSFQQQRHGDRWREDEEGRETEEIQRPNEQSPIAPKPLLKHGQRALSPLLSNSQHSSGTLLKYAASLPSLTSRLSSPEHDPNEKSALYYNLTIDSPGSSAALSSSTSSVSFSPHQPDLTRVKATVPSHVLSSPLTTTTNTTSSDVSSLRPHHGFQGPLANCLLRAISNPSKERMIRVALVEMNVAVSKIKTSRWEQLEHALRKHHFNRKHATPAPIDATTVRTVIGHVMAAYEKGNPNNRTKLATTMTVKGGEYIPYAERKKRKGKLRHGNALSTTSPSTASTTATSPMNRSLLQRQVAKQQRAMSQRQMSHARLHARAESSIEKQTFERNIQQSIRDRKWEKE